MWLNKDGPHDSISIVYISSQVEDEHFCPNPGEPHWTDEWDV